MYVFLNYYNTTGTAPPLQSQNTPEAGGLLVMTIFNVSEGFRLSFFCHYVIKYIVQILLFRWALGGIFQEINLEKLKKATYPPEGVPNAVVPLWGPL